MASPLRGPAGTVEVLMVARGESGASHVLDVDDPDVGAAVAEGVAVRDRAGRDG
jgi:hypothetical protein